MADASLGKAVLRTQLDASGLRVGLAQAEKDTKTSAQRISADLAGIGKGLQGVGTRLTIGITAPLTALGVVGVKSAMQLETFAASLRVLIGDADRANKVFEQLYEFSANVPFDWRTLTDATRTLAGFGVEAEDVVGTLSRLGDIAAGTQSDLVGLSEIYGRVLVTGRLSMQEVNSLALRGVPIYQELANVLGASSDHVRDLISTGTIGFPELQRVITNLTSEGGKFFGMMDAQADTVQGRFNRLKDSFEQVTDVVGDRLVPAFDWLIGRGQALTDWFTELDETTQGLFVGLGVTLSTTGPVLLGVGTLMVQLPKLAAGFRAVQLAMGPLFGPVGLFLTAAGLIAGVAVAFSGRGDSLDKSIDKAKGALASGDAESLTGAIQEVADKLDEGSPLRARLLELQGELKRTGEVGVEAMNAIKEALAEAAVAPLRAELAALKASVDQRQRLLAGYTGDDAARQVRIEEIEAIGNKILDEGGTVPQELMDELMQLRLASEGLGLNAAGLARQQERLEADRARMAELEKQIAERLGAGGGGGGGGGGGEGPPGKQDPDAIAKRVQTLRDELKFLQREVDFGLADVATLAERQFGAVDTAVRDLIRLGAGNSLIETLLGDRSEFEAAVRERAVRIAPLMRAELLDDRLRSERNEIDTFARIAAHEARVAQQRAESERLAAIARAPIIRAVEWDDSWFAERQQIEEDAIRAHNEARIAQQKRESERLAAVARAPMIRADEWDRAWFSEMETTQQLVDDLAAARVVAENRRQAEIRRIMSDFTRPTSGLLSDQWSSYFGADVSRQAARMRGMDITTTNTDRTVKAERELAMARAESARESNQLLADFARSENERILALRYGGRAGEEYTRQAQLQADALSLAAREGITLTEAFAQMRDTGRSIADVQADLAKAQEEWRTAGDEAGRIAAHALINRLESELAAMQPKDLTIKPFATFDGKSWSDYEREQRALQDASQRFAETVVNAGFAFGDAAIRAFQDGDIVGIIRAGISGSQSIVGGLGDKLGTVSLFGGVFNIAGLIAGGLGLVGTLIGALAGGGSRDAQERRQREAATARSVPAININFNVQQTNNYAGGPRQPENELAFSRQADSLFESFYTRVLSPRLDRIERAAGLATGA